MNGMARILAALALAAIASAAAVQDAPAADAKADAKDPKAVQRADLGLAYLRLDQAYMAHPPTDDAKIAEINQGFDKATLAFFGGKNAEAVQQINALTATLDPATATSPAYAVAASLKLIGQEPIWPYANWTMAVAPHLVSMYSVDLEPQGNIELRFQVKDDRGIVQTFLDHPFTISTGPGVKVDQGFSAFADELPPGRYDVDIAGPNDFTFHLGHWHVIPRPIKEIRDENDAKLAAVKAETPELERALATCRARNKLLGDLLSPEKSAQIVVDPNELIRSLEREIAALAEGKNPYRRRAGDIWRVLPSSPKDVPFRLYVPQAAAAEEPSPLVIALHGAGGDENMFIDGYGAGLIKKLAEKSRFIVASPATSLFSGSSGALDRMVEALSEEYAIDQKRIYVIGHSMGASATASLAKKHHAKLAAACCMAGGSAFTGGDGLAPTLVICAELDGVVPLARVQPAAEAAIKAGLPVEFRLKKNYGHTLMVGMALPEAIEWLLARSK